MDRSCVVAIRRCDEMLENGSLGRQVLDSKVCMDLSSKQPVKEGDDVSSQ